MAKQEEIREGIEKFVSIDERGGIMTEQEEVRKC